MFFNIFINDLLFQIEKTVFYNYADDIKLFACERDINEVISRLENDSALTSKWFSDNCMKLNEDKCHLITLDTNNADAISMKVSSSTVYESNHDQLIVAMTDNRLTFEENLGDLSTSLLDRRFIT